MEYSMMADNMLLCTSSNDNHKVFVGHGMMDITMAIINVHPLTLQTAHCMEGWQPTSETSCSPILNVMNSYRKSVFFHTSSPKVFKSEFRFLAIQIYQ